MKRKKITETEVKSNGAGNSVELKISDRCSK
jgi:hypothetical protein